MSAIERVEGPEWVERGSSASGRRSRCPVGPRTSELAMTGRSRPTTHGSGETLETLFAGEAAQFRDRLQRPLLKNRNIDCRNRRRKVANVPLVNGPNVSILLSAYRSLLHSSLPRGLVRRLHLWSSSVRNRKAYIGRGSALARKYGRASGFLKEASCTLKTSVAFFT